MASPGAGRTRPAESDQQEAEVDHGVPVADPARPAETAAVRAARPPSSAAPTSRPGRRSRAPAARHRSGLPAPGRPPRCRVRPVRRPGSLPGRTVGRRRAAGQRSTPSRSDGGACWHRRRPTAVQLRTAGRSPVPAHLLCTETAVTQYLRCAGLVTVTLIDSPLPR